MPLGIRRAPKDASSPLAEPRSFVMQDEENATAIDSASDNSGQAAPIGGADGEKKKTAQKDGVVAGDINAPPRDKTDVYSVHSGAESGEINYRSMSWKKASGLLFGEYVCLAILSFPGAFATLGMAGGMLTVLLLGLSTLYTSLTLHKYCLKYPHLLHIADIGKQIFGGSRIAYELTFLALILNNTFLMGLHTLTGAEIINTLASPGSVCTVGISILVMFCCGLGTIPRKLENVAVMGMVSAVTMFIAIVLTMAFSGAQGRQPTGILEGEPVRITAFAPPGTTFVEGWNAVLTIVFTWTGQIVYPTFISECSRPEDFHKALYAVTVAETVLFCLTGIVVYWYAGQYTGSPAVSSLDPVFRKIAFSFVLPTTIIIGIIYASTAAKMVFARIFGGTRHYASNTFVGWAGWITIVFALWTFGWIIGEAIPFFGTLISLMSALFDGWFGFIFWAFAYFEIKKGQLWKGQSLLRKAETALNCFLVVVGAFITGPGIYTTVQAILNDYAEGSVSSPFTCASNAI